MFIDTAVAIIQEFWHKDRNDYPYLQKFQLKLLGKRKKRIVTSKNIPSFKQIKPGMKVIGKMIKWNRPH